MLHIDSGPNRQSEILCTGRTCENKWKQSRSLKEMWVCVCYEMIYADVHMRYMESQSWVSLSLWPEEIRSITESASEWLDTPLE